MISEAELGNLKGSSNRLTSPFLGAYYGGNDKGQVPNCLPTGMKRSGEVLSISLNLTSIVHFYFKSQIDAFRIPNDRITISQASVSQIS